MDLIARISELLDEHGWLKYQLAKEADLSQSTISSMMKRSNNPTVSTIERCCAAFGISVAEFFCDDLRVTFKVEFDSGATEVEKNVLYQFNHVTRGDASEYYLRSSVPRMFEYSTSIPARERKNRQIKHGDVLVVNDNLSHYLGEVEVALRDFEDDGTRNIVGRIPEDELFLLDYVKPEFPFGFVKD